MYAIDPHDSLVPIFIEHKNSERLEQIGTGIFVEFQNTPFLFTAAHVTDLSNHGTLMAPTASGIIAIEGYMAYVDLLPDNKREDDSTDIAYFRLSNKFAQLLLTHFKPLHQSRCEIAHNAKKPGVYSICGYPISKSRKNEEIFSSEFASFRGIYAEESIYKEQELSSDSSIIVRFNRKKAVSPLSGTKINPVGPRGVSGGGIFSWPDGHELSNDWSLTRLVGIFHTYKEKKGLMIGTNLMPLIAAIQLGTMKKYGDVE